MNSGVTLGATTVTMSGNLEVVAGTLELADSVSTVTGTTLVDNGATISLTNATGLKTFTGNVTIASGGHWTEGAVAVAVTYAGNLTNNGTYTATTGSGVHTFSSGTCALSGTLAIPSVSISGTCTNANALTVATLLTIAGTLTNNGTVTATASLAGAGTFVQGTAGTLEIGALSGISHFNAAAAGNTVNYTGAGQIIKDPDQGTAHTYSNLGLSGSGVKNATGANLIVGQTLTITAGTLSMTGNSNTANKLYFGTAYKLSGTWGAVASGATHKTDTYFTNGVNAYITVTHGSASATDRGGVTITYTPPVTIVTPPETTPEVTPPVTPVVVPGCSEGNLFSTQTGAACTGNEVLQIPGCGNRATGFSTTTGTSCVGNHVTADIPPTSGYAFGTTLVKQGSTGGACMAWQSFLNDHAGAHLSADGACGPLTMAAARLWQTSKGLVSDGLLGAMSRAKANAQ